MRERAAAVSPLDASAVLTSARRLLVIGCPGSGKTVFARRLGVLNDVPVVHLDDLYFGSRWRPTPPEDWRERIRRLCAEPEWIIDGNYAVTLPERLARADAVVLLNRAPVLCLAGYLRRLVDYTRVDHERLPHYMRLDGGRRRIADAPLSFAKFILTFRRHVLPQLRTSLNEREDVPVVEFRTRADATGALADLRKTRC